MDNQKLFRVIVKNTAGYLSVYDDVAETPLQILKRFKPKYIFSIEEQHPKLTSLFTTVFAIKGGRVFISSKDILLSGEIERRWPKTQIGEIVEV